MAIESRGENRLSNFKYKVHTARHGTCGFQSQSNRITVSAAVSVRPTPPARVDSRNTNAELPARLNLMFVLSILTHNVGTERIE